LKIRSCVEDLEELARWHVVRIRDNTASKANQSFMGNAFRATKAASPIIQKRSCP